MHFFEMALTLFFVLDPLGNIPVFLAVLKEFDPKRQRNIILREMLIALAILLLFVFLGGPFFTLLQIELPVIEIAGGIILFLVSLKMVFPPTHSSTVTAAEKEPFVVPLAVPFIAGPAVISMLVVFSQAHQSSWLLSGALLVAWIPSALLLIFSSVLKKLLGKGLLDGLERLMGMVLVIFSVKLFADGLQEFFK